MKGQFFNQKTFSNLEFPMQKLMDLNVKMMQNLYWMKPNDLLSTKKPEDIWEKHLEMLMLNSHMALDYMQDAFNMLENHWFKTSHSFDQNSKKFMDEAFSNANKLQKKTKSTIKKASSTAKKATSGLKKAASSSIKKASSSLKKSASGAKKASSSIKKAASGAKKAPSSIKKTASSTKKAASGIKKAASSIKKPGVKKAGSSAKKSSSSLKSASSSLNKPIKKIASSAKKASPKKSTKSTQHSLHNKMSSSNSAKHIPGSLGMQSKPGMMHSKDLKEHHKPEEKSTHYKDLNIPHMNKSNPFPPKM